jgi:DNA modification methylase
MIQMWDATFTAMNPAIGDALSEEQGAKAVELMHCELDRVWQECVRALKPGGTLCINVGDAVRTIADDFQMYSNHARVISAMGRLGMAQLPDILWRKPTNAPNKFMGSGTLPVGAYVTYEHEYILIFRKGKRRTFTEDEKPNRRASAFFWEERNKWFSDIWEDLQGSTQGLADPTARQRSGAYPFELAYRLICMHSTYGDTVLDPFLGTGTTMTAAIAAGRNSIGVELNEGLRETIAASVAAAVTLGANRVMTRFCEHKRFIDARLQMEQAIKHKSRQYGFPVITSQEIDIVLFLPCSQSTPSADTWKIEYESILPL